MRTNTYESILSWPQPFLGFNTFYLGNMLCLAASWGREIEPDRNIFQHRFVRVCLGLEVRTRFVAADDGKAGRL